MAKYSSNIEMTASKWMAVAVFIASIGISLFLNEGSIFISALATIVVLVTGKQATDAYKAKYENDK